MLARKHPILTALLIFAMGAVVYAQTVPPRRDTGVVLQYDVRTQEPSRLLQEVRLLRHEVARQGR